MNIHIMPIDKFTNEYIKYMNRQYELSDNLFYIYEYGASFAIESYANVQTVAYLSSEIDLSKLCESSDKLVIHSLLSASIIKFLYFNQEKIDFGRIILVVWGGDIYNCNLSGEISNEKERELEDMKRILLKKIKKFMTFACADFEYMQKVYGVSGIQYDCLYPSSIDYEFLCGLRNTSNKSTVIQLGNSATFTNQHMNALEILSKYKFEAIKIICPLSYGNDEYRNLVISYGRNIFGNKFVPVLKYMNPKDYAKMLNRVDIAIFNNNRQQATANIEILSFLGKKIYIRSDNSLWKHYVLRDKCAFEDVEKIRTQSFEEFKYHSQNSININRKYFKKIWDENYIKSLWDTVLYS